MRKWIVPIVTTIIAVIISIAAYDSLPSQMAVNYGESDTFMDKRIAVSLMPVLILVLSGMTLFLIRMEKDENKRKRAELIVSAINSIATIVLLAAHGFMVAYNLDYPLNFAIFVTLTVGSTFVLIGNLVPRLPQGTYEWPKIEHNSRRQLMRFSGKLMVAFGLIFMILALIPGSYIFPVFFALLGAFIIITAGKSIHVVQSK
ncbi:DUF1648 domain-containing protein [Oceanobacillus jeddahense]|uniref:DUF1648 domain-containing protein n=1 Tax=Oceanobacillus jeddahense TaxID=1462527 RepID=UPI0005960EAB|nr:DUF1648 domain-containing protein [Oceanobacillus jeddahense]